MLECGLEDEWLTAFTGDQILKSTAMVGQDLLQRFGWPTPTLTEWPGRARLDNSITQRASIKNVNNNRLVDVAGRGFSAAFVEVKARS